MVSVAYPDEGQIVITATMQSIRYMNFAFIMIFLEELKYGNMAASYAQMFYGINTMRFSIRDIPTSINRIPATRLKYLIALAAFFRMISIMLIKIDIITNGMASPAEYTLSRTIPS